MLVSTNLYERVLIEPANNEDVDKLTIVSGYATASMLSRHYQELLADIGDVPIIDLTVGMTPSSGLAYAQHKVFNQLEEELEGKIRCRYVTGESSVHAKVYVWSKLNSPVVAYAGSSNYTHSGFRASDRIEVMSQVDALSAYTFCERIRLKSQSCSLETISELITIFEPQETPSLPIEIRHAGECVRLPLIVKSTGETHKQSGLNWGQREDRDPDQAYIPIPAKIYKSDFFPPRGERFVVETDDGETMFFVRAQDDGKALHTPIDNSQIGAYIRRRLNVQSGAFVTRADLDRYGRIDVTFFKVGDETYYLDFGV